jgi:hypothetical protein
MAGEKHDPVIEIYRNQSSAAVDQKELALKQCELGDSMVIGKREISLNHCTSRRLFRKHIGRCLP